MTVKLTDIHSLPICPSASTVRSIPPSQQAAVLDRISSTLLHALSLSDDQLSKISCRDFISTYTRAEAAKVLNGLIFLTDGSETERRPAQEKVIRKRVLSLTSRLAAVLKAGGLSLQIIVDICIVYGPKNSAKVNELVGKAVRSNPILLQEFRNSAAPSFVSILLSSDSGLHALRKTAYCLKCLLQSVPAVVIDEFLKDNEFIIAIVKCYDLRLSAIAAGYGGINIDRVDETETTTVWIGCKVALIDSFHVLLERILNQVRADPRTHAERAFGLLFALLNLPSASSQSSVRPTPFLNRTLVADYQDAYGLSSTLASVLSNNDDPRLDVLEATLKSFETEIDNDNKAGALRVVLRSNGVPPGIDNRGVSAKGKGRAVPEPEPIPGRELDAAVSSVLDILPDQDPGYVRELLALPQYDGNAERIVAALLEGDAPPPSTLRTESETVPAPVLHAPLPERRNVFNEQPIDTTTVNIGKRRGDADVVLQDHAFLDQMKADILHRAAELSSSDGEDVDAEDEDLESVLDSAVKVAGDGEESEEDEEGEGEVQAPAPPQTPETICELAYIKDPSVFDRDSFTRRSKSRTDLKAQTGWSDEQLEGWRIMLEKNPKKDKILQKHEFAGNKKGPIPGSSSGQAGGSSRGGRGRGRGRGGPGRGGGRGGRGGGESAKGDGGGARERAWKDKNKARQANHNRKRGHDRKMARGGAIPGPST